MVWTEENVKAEMESDGVDMGMSGYMKAWFLFCGLLALSMFVGGVYVVYLLLFRFGVIA